MTFYILYLSYAWGVTTLRFDSKDICHRAMETMKQHSRVQRARCVEVVKT